MTAVHRAGGLVQRAKRWARAIKRDVLTLWFARRHPHTPWSAKLLGLVVVAYALSPIDLIPDFIPVLGFVDDVLLLPGLIWLTLRLLPPQVLGASRQQATDWLAHAHALPRSRVGAAVIVALWVVGFAAVLAWGLRRWG